MSLVQNVKEKLTSRDYVSSLDAKQIAKEAHNLTNTARDKAYVECEHYKKRRSEKVANAWRGVLYLFITFLSYALILALFFGFIGWVIPGEFEGIGFIIGILTGLILVIYPSLQSLWKYFNK